VVWQFSGLQFFTGYLADAMDFLAIAIILIVLFFALIKGVIKTFKRQPVVAILCIIFLFPFYLVWAFVEMFTGPVEQGPRS
jgi:hypothetical protein